MLTSQRYVGEGVCNSNHALERGEKVPTKPTRRWSTIPANGAKQFDLINRNNMNNKKIDALLYCLFVAICFCQHLTKGGNVYSKH